MSKSQKNSQIKSTFQIICLERKLFCTEVVGEMREIFEIYLHIVKPIFSYIVQDDDDNKEGDDFNNQIKIEV